MVACDVDFSGDSYEITQYEADDGELLKNINVTTTFLEGIGDVPGQIRRVQRGVELIVGGVSELDFHAGRVEVLADLVGFLRGLFRHARSQRVLGRGGAAAGAVAARKQGQDQQKRQNQC